ncbi:MAG TPA: PilZ domain-containing protein [Candidatus Dormibacteraeota bacterium]|nr:PilZ domain-containing protein [Candidatus Dormibacteraeota bacterium]
MAQAAFAIRRMNPRFPCAADAEITFHDGNALRAKLSELSSRGCYIDTLQPVPVGTEMHIAICDGPSRCEVDGKVIYGHAGSGFGVFGMGVVFAEMSSEQNLTIAAWLNELAAQASKRNEPAYES